MAALTVELKYITNQQVVASAFPLLHNLLESFAAVDWSRPERYLEPEIRHGISTFTKISREALSEGLANVSRDIENGTRDKRSGHLRSYSQQDVGYRFV